MSKSKFEDNGNCDDATLETKVSYSRAQENSNICESEQELINALDKLKIDDLHKLSKRFQRSDQHKRGYRKGDTEEETEEQAHILEQLKDLKLFSDEFEQLKRIKSMEGTIGVMEHGWREQELIDIMKKLNFDDFDPILGRLPHSEQSIKDSREADREKTMKDEMDILKQLKGLKILSDGIQKSKFTGTPKGGVIVLKPDWFKQECHVHDMNKSSEQIRPTGVALQEKDRTNSAHEIKSNYQYIKNEGSKRPHSNDTNYPPAKKFHETSRTISKRQFYVQLCEVKLVTNKKLREPIQQKCQDLCSCTHRGFPGSHPVCMDRANYKMIFQSPYMVRSKSIGKRYMMLIEERQVYMFDQGNSLFEVKCLDFPDDEECRNYLKDTLIDGEFVIDNINGSENYSFWISDIIIYRGENVAKKPLPDRLRLISQSIVSIRDSAIQKHHINEKTQAFTIRCQKYFDLSKLNELLSDYCTTIPHEIEGFIFLPKEEPYRSGECPNVLKWKETQTIEFRLEIIIKSAEIGSSPKKEAHLFLNHTNNAFAKMCYSPNLDQYHNQIISCFYKDNQWHFHRLRNDRPFANAVKSAAGVIIAMENPVTRELLCNLEELR